MADVTANNMHATSKRKAFPSARYPENSIEK
jgi:hypothetical protein